MKTANFRLENGCEVRGICRSANFRLGNEYEVREISKTANFSRNLSSGVRIFLKDDSYVPILAEEKPKNWNFFFISHKAIATINANANQTEHEH